MINQIQIEYFYVTTRHTNRPTKGTLSSHNKSEREREKGVGNLNYILSFCLNLFLIYTKSTLRGNNVTTISMKFFFSLFLVSKERNTTNYTKTFYNKRL